MVNQFNIHSIKLKSSEAIKRDEQRNFSEALKQYGACMQSLSQLLKEDTLLEDVKDPNNHKQVMQAVKICKMCFERVYDILDKEATGNPSTTSFSNPPNNSLITNQPQQIAQSSPTPSITSSFNPNISFTSSNVRQSIQPTSTPSTLGSNPAMSSSMFVGGNRASLSVIPSLSSVGKSTSFSGINNMQVGKTETAPPIEFQPPPGAITPREIPASDRLSKRLSSNLSEMTSFGTDLDKKEKRKSLLPGLGDDTNYDSGSPIVDDREGDNMWSRHVRSKFIALYSKDKSYKTRDELFDRELMYTESAEEQWANIRSYISQITDLISQHPLNGALTFFTQKFNEEFQVKEDTVWLNVHDANKQILEMATAIVNELSQSWNCLAQSPEMRHYFTKALSEGIVKRVYKTLVEVYETQQPNKLLETKLEDIGSVSMEDLGVDDPAILSSPEIFLPSIESLDSINVGKNPYSAIDSLVNMNHKMIEAINTLSSFESLSDTSQYGIVLYIIQASKTRNLPSTINLIKDYIQEEEMSQDEKDVLSLVENVLDWANQFEV